MKRIAVIPGDGIGPEVIPAGLAVVRRVAESCGFPLAFEHFDWGCEHYRRTGRMMAADALDRLADFDAIYLGAIGAPDVPDHVSIWEMVLPIRQRFDQYVNLRPIKLLPGVASPLAGRGPADVDMVCVRENSEGEYSGVGRLDADGAREEAIFTRRGIERVARYAFELAARRPRRLLASATKSNALRHSMVLWDEVVEQVARDHPQVSWRKYHPMKNGELDNGLLYDIPIAVYALTGTQVGAGPLVFETSYAKYETQMKIDFPASEVGLGPALHIVSFDRQ